ncbi:MAG: hypothetical protein RIQ88_368 [Actinomycetota bacterium]|jgi:uncharacterized protein
MFQLRTCIGCRQEGPRSDFLRVVLQQGKPEIDIRKNLPGRGAWLHNKLSCLDLAVSRGSFPRAFRSKISIKDLATLKEQAEMMLDK